MIRATRDIARPLLAFTPPTVILSTKVRTCVAYGTFKRLERIQYASFGPSSF
jgi:hypothetical protein